MPRDSFSGHLDLVLLASLERASMHGYALIDHMRSTSGGRLDYPEGTIYPALRRLEDQGLVRSRWSDSDGRRRRVYSLTAKGARSLESHRSEWDSYVGGVQALLGHG
jgi:PadR family transcriptional regulator, regulatory protein PadR